MSYHSDDEGGEEDDMEVEQQPLLSWDDLRRDNAINLRSGTIADFFANLYHDASDEEVVQIFNRSQANVDPWAGEVEAGLETHRRAITTTRECFLGVYGEGRNTAIGVFHCCSYCEPLDSGWRFVALRGDQWWRSPLVAASPDLVSTSTEDVRNQHTILDPVVGITPRSLDEIITHFSNNPRDNLVSPAANALEEFGDGEDVLATLEQFSVGRLLPIHPKWACLFMRPLSPCETVALGIKLLNTLSQEHRVAAKYFEDWLRACATEWPLTSNRSMLHYNWMELDIRHFGKWYDSLLRLWYPAIYDDRHQLFQLQQTVVDEAPVSPVAAAPVKTEPDPQPVPGRRDVVIGKGKFSCYNRSFENEVIRFYRERLAENRGAYQGDAASRREFLLLKENQDFQFFRRVEGRFELVQRDDLSGLTSRLRWVMNRLYGKAKNQYLQQEAARLQADGISNHLHLTGISHDKPLPSPSGEFGDFVNYK